MKGIYRQGTLKALILGTIVGGLAGAGHGAIARDLVLSMNDGHTALDQSGKMIGAAHLTPDTVTLIDITGDKAKIFGTSAVPGNVEGPPTAAWISKDASWGIVTSGTKVDPAVPGVLMHNALVSLVSFDSKTPHIVSQAKAGEGATGVAVSPDETMLLVANRFAGTISIFHMQDRKLVAVGMVDLGGKSTPTSIVFLKDGKHALVARHGRDDIAVLTVDGGTATLDTQSIPVGHFPVTMDYNATTDKVAVGNMGAGKGEIDSVSIIDVHSAPYRVSATLPVGSAPEPLKFSPDGRFLAVGSVNGSNKPGSSFYHKDGYLQIFSMDRDVPHKITEIPVGAWPQGIGFSRDGHEILVQNMTDRTLSVLHFDGVTAKQTGLLKLDAGPASMATPW